MTKQEFETLVTAKTLPTESEWEAIQTVYAFHPSISETQGKSQIAYLYSTFGMRVIRDMLPTAKMAATIENQIRTTRLTLERLKAEYKELVDGAL